MLRTTSPEYLAVRGGAFDYTRELTFHGGMRSNAASFLTNVHGPDFAHSGTLILLLCMVGLVHVHAKAYNNA